MKPARYIILYNGDLKEWCPDLEREGYKTRREAEEQAMSQADEYRGMAFHVYKLVTTAEVTEEDEDE